VQGALLDTTIGWQWSFWLTAILDVIIIPCAFFFIPKDKATEVKGRIDYLGAFSGTAGILLTTTTISAGVNFGWVSYWVLGLGLGAVACLIFFIWWETKCSNPILPPSLWKIHSFGSTLFVVLVTAIGFEGLFYHIVLL